MAWLGTLQAGSYEGEVKEGDLIEAKPGMLLVNPRGLMIVLKCVLEGEAWEVMYLSNNYITTVDRIDIKSVISS